MGGIDLGAVKARIEGDTSGLEESVTRAKGVLDGFSASAVGMGAAIGAGFAIVSSAGELISELANGVLEAGRAMADAVVQVAEFSEHLTNLSMVTGLSVDALQSMGKAAVESGTSADSFINAVTRMEVKLGSGTKQVQQAVSALGLSWRELVNSSPDEAFNRIAKSLSEMTDVAERNAAAQRLFGRSFQDVLPAIQAYLEAGDRYINLSDAQRAAGLEMDKSLDALKTSWTELWQQIGATLNTPEVRQGIADIAQAIRNITIAVKDGSGPVAGFFKAIAEHANNSVKWVVFLGGALDGLKERMASPTKDTPGAIAAGLKALDAFEARVEADKNKQLGRGMFPSLFEGEKPTLGALGAGADSTAAAKAAAKAAEAAAKESAKWDKFLLSQDKDFHQEALRWQKQFDAEQLKAADIKAKAILQGVIDRQRQEKFFEEEGSRSTIALMESTARSVNDHLATQIKQIQAKYGQMIQSQKDRAASMGVAADDPRLQAIIARWEAVAEAEIRATREAAKYAAIQEKLSGVATILSDLNSLLGALGISADSAFGRIVTGAQSAVASIQSGVSAFQTLKAGLATGGFAGILGAISGGIGIATAAVSVVRSIAGIFNKPEYKKIMSDVGKSWGVSISEGLAKEIEAIAKTNKISRSLAELLATSKIMAESGKDPRVFTKQITDLMNAIKSGAVPAAQGMEELGRAFNMVADAAVKSGTVGDRALVGLIKRARELGTVTPEMTAFVGAQLDSAIEGIHKYVAAINKIGEASNKSAESQARFAEISKTSGVVFGAAFEAMVAEKGIVAAVDAMKGDFDSLHKTLMDTLGPEATAQILGPFGGAFATLSDETLRPIFDGIDGITQAMTGLANAGYLSIDQFGAMQTATTQLFDEAIAGGADMRTALLAVAPGIKAAISAAEQFGVPLDADMARLKALAEQNGITFATDPQAAMLDVLVSIAQVLGADVPASALRARNAMTELAASVPRDLDVNLNVNRTYRDIGGGGGGGGMEVAPEAFIPPEEGGGFGKWPEFQHGGIMNASPLGSPAILHGREAVVPISSNSGAVSAAPGTNAPTLGGSTVTFNATFNVDPLQNNAARDDLAQFVINEFIRQARTSPMIRQLLRQDGGR